MNMKTIFFSGLSIGLIALTVASGGLAFVLIVGFGIWYWTLRRGRLSVRAYVYLRARQDGATVAEANYAALRLGYHEAAALAPMAKMNVETTFGGRQLPMIAMAREDGFLG